MLPQYGEVQWNKIYTVNLVLIQWLYEATLIF